MTSSAESSTRWPKCLPRKELSPPSPTRTPRGALVRRRTGTTLRPPPAFGGGVAEPATRVHLPGERRGALKQGGGHLVGGQEGFQPELGNRDVHGGGEGGDGREQLELPAFGSQPQWHRETEVVRP